MSLFFSCNEAAKESGNVEDTPKFKDEVFVPLSFEEADSKAESLLKLLSLDQKIDMLGGHDMFYTQGYDSLGIPQLYFSDATQGVRLLKEKVDGLKRSTAFPCPILLTSTWNPELAKQYAKSVGEECRAGGVAVLLGPGMNIYRISQNGRNFEYFGEDPFLAARMIEKYVCGVQSVGVAATLKHFVCNNTDFHRRMSNSVVDERTLREIYLPAFQAGVDAGAMAVMTSYNKVNGEWAAQSNYVVDTLLRQDLGFKGLVMSDWWSIWEPLKAMKSGLDLDMPGHVLESFTELKALGDDIYVKKAARKLYDEGKVTEADINRMVKSLLKLIVAMKFDERPAVDSSFFDTFNAHAETVLKVAREGIVLLRNQNNILPINADKVQKILLIGDYAAKVVRGGGSAFVEGWDTVTTVQALTAEFGNKLEFVQNPTDEQVKAADVVLLNIGTEDSEGYDRPFELDANKEQNVRKIAELNPRTVVIVNSGSGIRMTDWNDKVAGIIYSWYMGQNGATALAEIICGKTNPSGKLPITIEKNFADSPGANYIPKDQQLYTGWGGDFLNDKPYDVNYKEGVFVGYRWYENRKIEPLYPFGFGLSYTTFEISDVKLSAEKFTAPSKISVDVTIKNTGTVAGAEVVQLYIEDVEASVARPVKELKAFSKVLLQAGETKSVTMELSESDFSFWDVEKSSWRAEPGIFKLHIGNSSNYIAISKQIVLE